MSRSKTLLTNELIHRKLTKIALVSLKHNYFVLPTKFNKSKYRKTKINWNDKLIFLYDKKKYSKIKFSFMDHKHYMQ